VRVKSVKRTREKGSLVICSTVSRDSCDLNWIKEPEHAKFVWVKNLQQSLRK
jgi:hypothetical protein